MKNFFTLLLCVLVTINLYAQRKGLISQPFENLKTIPSLTLQTPNLSQIHLEDEEREKNGALYRIGTAISTNINPSLDGDWKINSDGNMLEESECKLDITHHAMIDDRIAKITFYNHHFWCYTSSAG